MVPRKAIVVGATGVVGRYVLAHLVRSGDWQAVAVSRRLPDLARDYGHIAVDLLDGAEARARLGGLDDATHVFFAAYIERADPAALVADSLTLLLNARMRQPAVQRHQWRLHLLGEPLAAIRGLLSSRVRPRAHHPA